MLSTSDGVWVVMATSSYYIIIFRFWPKTMDIRHFERNGAHSLCSFYSTVEGATKLKFAPLCSP